MNDEYYMKLALKQAKKAYKHDEVPVGAIIVYNNKIVAKAYNIKNKKKDSTAHAEIIAIRKASKRIGDWRLNNCTIYTTLQPCMMCYGAIKESRIGKLVFGATRINSELCFKNSQIVVLPGILKNECLLIIQNFFKRKRK